MMRSYTRNFFEKFGEAVKNASELIAPLQTRIPNKIGNVATTSNVDLQPIIQDSNKLIDQGHIGPVIVMNNLDKGIITPEQAHEILREYNQEQ